MKKLIYLLCALACTGVLPAAADGFADYSGRDLYTRFCATCHGDFGRGDGRVGQALAVVVPDLTTLAERQGGQINVEQLMSIIDGRTVITAHGTRYMPVWGYEFWV
ncbi:MAG: c-type cytochrome, partial [Gammaproteobacteria bacterium]|nr:c-type cytochrome [Gammaproteobacteria bacterium]